MALLYMDGFDTGTTQADLTARGWSVTNMSKTSGRNGTSGVGGGNAVMFHYFPATADLIVGVAFYVNNSAGTILRTYWNTSSMCYVALEGTYLKVVGASGSTIVVGTTPVPENVWNYLELKVHVADSPNGTAEIRLNGVSQGSGTGDTKASTFTQINNIALGPSSASVTVLYDDLYICDASGSAPWNTFLGDVRVETLRPTAAGAHSDWTPSAGSNYQNVDDADPDGDTTYNSSASAGDIDTFVFGDLQTVSGNVLGVQHLVDARKDDAGSRSVAGVARIGTTDYPGSSLSIGDNYAYWTEILPQSPASSSAWTLSEVNGAQFGYKLIS